jgi:hypothetical protein
MTVRMDHRMSWISRLSAPAGLGQIRGDTQRGIALRAALRTNSHIHLPPNFSAFESVDQAVELAAAQGVRILGAGNYYDFSVYIPFAEKCLANGIYPLFGLEIIALLDELRRAEVLINDPGNPGKMYLCGKGITRFVDQSPEARRLVGIIRTADETRMRRMIDLLRYIFDAAGVRTDLDETRIVDRIMSRYGAGREIITLQERHVAQAFQEELFRLVAPAQRSRTLAELFGIPTRAEPEDAVSVQNEIRSHLMKVGKPGFVEESFVNLDQAYRLILELGGIPCYPTLADGTSPICGYEDPPEKLIETLKRNRIHCAEFIPLRNDPGVLIRYVKAMRRAGFVVTAGTEHNTLDLFPMEPTCRHGVPVPDELREIFLEGVCVVAAHQSLGLQGHAGYVDSNGNLNPDFHDGEERIEYFHRAGAALVTRALRDSQ